jgi:hypothetical protein
MGDHRLFSDFSTEELELELRRRQDTKPAPLPNRNWAEVIAYVQVAIDRLHADQGLPKDFEHYLMETVLVTMFGTDIWKWWNNHQ